MQQPQQQQRRPQQMGLGTGFIIREDGLIITNNHVIKGADVINVHKDTPHIEMIRAKFLSEHTHSEDEVRFFVDGEGSFYFHLQERKEVFKLLCQKGDFISVPQNVTHWFDLAPTYFVKAIRVFQTPEGWIASYTNSNVDKKYIHD
jgi:1,2-dihydroxy-3-keto-5-methylthiopentene dioxygenase